MIIKIINPYEQPFNSEKLELVIENAVLLHDPNALIVSDDGKLPQVHPTDLITAKKIKNHLDSDLFIRRFNLKILIIN